MDGKFLRHRLLLTAFKRGVAACLLGMYLLTGLISPHAFALFSSPFSIEKAEAATGINKIINYQGKVSGIGGAAVANGSYNMRFKIYDAATGGNVLWSENWTNSSTRVTMTGGLFSVGLGTHVTMTGSVNFNTDNIYLQVEFDPGNDGTFEETFAPRRRFGSVPYAFNTDTLDGLDSTKFLRTDTNGTATGSIVFSNVGIGIEVVGTASGKIIQATQQLRSSGSLVVEGTTTLASYASCAIITTDANGNLGCGSSVKASTGSVIAVGDSRYVNTSGDTMTGALRIMVSGGNRMTLGLETENLLSGSVIRAQDTLASSGNLVIEGAMSGASLFVGSTIRGAGLTDCDLTTSTVRWDDTTGRFSCGTIAATAAEVGTASFSGAVFRLGNPQYVNVGGDTMTGALNINITSGVRSTVGLNVINTISGAVIQASKTLASSGTLVWEGAASGATLVVSGQFSGAGLTDCDLSSQKLTWDASTNRFGCATLNAAPEVGTASFSGAVFRLGNPQYVNVGGDTMTGALAINITSGTINTIGLRVLNTFSGAIIHASQQLRSSGSLIVEGATRLQSGAIISRAANSDFLTLNDTTNSDSVSLKTGVGNPNGSVNAQLGSLFIASDTGKLWKNNNGATQWSEIATGSGSAHMAKITRDAVQSIPNAAVSKVYFDTEEFDVGDIANTTPGATGSGRITIKKAGKYLVTGLYQPTSVSTNVIAYIFKNGVAVSQVTDYGPSAALASNVTDILDLGVNDYIELYVYQDLGSAQNMNTALSVKTRLSVIQIDANGGGAGGSSKWTDNGSVTYLTDTADNLAIGATSADTKLEVIGTISGSSLKIKNSIASSGSLVWEGAASGASLYIGGSLQGAGLTDCDLSTSTLRWDVTTGRFSCGTIAATAPEVGTLAFSGAIYRLGDSRYVNTSGDTMTGALVINVTGGNRNTLGLNVINTISGAVIQASKTLASSGTLVWEGAASGATLVVSGQFSGAGLTDCDLSTQKLTWDASTNRFGCATLNAAPEVGTASFSGAVFRLGNPQYVNVGGDTMTGTLIIDLSSGFVGLNVKQTLSGSKIYASTSLASSGTLVVENTVARGSGALTVIQQAEFATGAYIYSSGTVLALDTYSANGATKHILFGYRGQFDTNLYRSAVNTLKTDGSFFATNVISGSVLRGNTLASSGSLTWEGAASGATLVVSGQFSGAGLTDCDLSTQKLTWDSSTNRFGCTTLNVAPEVGTISFSGAVLRLGDNRYVRTAGDTMTGALVVNLTSGFVGLNVKQTISGATIYASRSLMSSGTLVVENTVARGSGALTVIQQAEFATGAYIYSSGTVLALDSYSSNGANKHILFGYLGNFDTNLYRSAATILKTDGSLFVSNTISGSVVRGNTLASSGSLTWEGAASGASLYIGGSLQGAGLTDCDLSTSVLKWDSSTGRFSCGSASTAPEVGTAAFSGAVFRLGNPQYVNVGGDTMTGALAINITSGTINTIGLRVLNTFSGAIIHASQQLRSSGSLIVEGATRLQSGAIISRAANSDFLTLNDTTNSDSVSFKTGVGDPNGSVYAQLGSLFIASDTGKIWKNNNGITQWVEVTTGSGTTHMAKMTRTVAQSLPPNQQRKIYFDTEEFDVGDIGNIAAGSSGSGRITIKKSGKYLVTASLELSPIDAGERSEILIRKNNINSIIGQRIYSSAATGDSYPIATTVVDLVAGDYLEVYAFHDHTGSLDTLTSTHNRPMLSVVQVDGTTGAGGGTSKWTDGGAFTYLTDTADNLAIGATSADTKLEVIGTISGSTLVIKNSIASSGTLVWEGAGSGNSLYIASSLRAGRSLSTSGSLTWEGAASGATLVVSGQFSGAGLTDCDLSTQKLTWDASTNRFGCATLNAAPEVGTASFSGAVFRLSNPQYVNIGGDTMTGALTINITNGVRGTIGLNVINTISGAVISAQKTLASSGQLLVEQTGTSVGSGALSVVNTTRYGTGAYMAASGAILVLDSTTSSAGKTPHIMFGYKGTFDVTLARTAAYTLTLTGNLLPGATNTFDLGSDAMRWRDLYVSGGTMHIGSSGDEATIGYNTSSNTFAISTTNRENAFTILDSNGFIGIGTSNPDTLLEVIGTVSGSILHAQNGLRSSGSLIVEGNAIINGTLTAPGLASSTSLASSGSLTWEGAASGASLYLGGSLQGAGLTDCDLSTNALRWDATTGRFSCAVITTTAEVGTASFSGAVFRLSDARYVNVGGDTMTGALNIQNGNTHTPTALALLNVRGTMSGRSLYISGSGARPLMVTDPTRGALSINTTASYANLTVSGSFALSGSTTERVMSLGLQREKGGDSILWYDGNFRIKTDVTGSTGDRFSILSNGNVGIGVSNAETKLEVVGTISGSALTISSLRNCDTIDTDANGNFICGTDQAAADGLDLNTADARYVRLAGDTMTGALAINVTGGNRSTIGLNVHNTISGAVIRAQNNLASSGTLNVDGTSVLSNVTVATSLIYVNSAGLQLIGGGASTTRGYIDLPNGGGLGFYGPTALGAQNIIIDNRSNGGYITLKGGNVAIGADTADTTLEIIGTASGRVVRAQNTLASSGTLVWEGAASGASLYLGGSLQGAGLTDCDLSTNALRWDATTGRFSCATITTTAEVGTASFSGAVFRLSDVRYVNVGGDTMTGALTINITGGSRNTVGLNALNTVSGAVLHAEKSLTSSGTLVAESGAYLGADILFDPSKNHFIKMKAPTGSNFDGGNLTINAGDGIFTGGALVLEGGTTAAYRSRITINGTSEDGGDIDIVAADSLGASDIGGDINISAGAGTNESSGIVTIKGGENNLLGAGGAVYIYGGRGDYQFGEYASGSIILGANPAGAQAGNVGIGTINPKAKLDIRGTLSGSSVVTLSSYRSCTLKTTATGMVICGSDNTGGGGAPEVGTASFSGALFRLAGPQYVNVGGDTMTGALVISVTGGSRGTLGLNVANTISGAVIHAEKTLTSSGTIISTGDITTRGTLSGAALSILGNASIGSSNAGIIAGAARYLTITTRGTNTVAALELNGRASTSGNAVSRMSFINNHSANYEIARIESYLLNATDEGGLRFYTAQGGNSVRMTITPGGNVGIGTTDPSAALEVLGTISGTTLYARQALSTSGTLVWEGAASGATLYLGGSLQGAGLTDCDNGATSKLLWDATTGRFSCGTDQTGGSGSPEVGTASFSGALFRLAGPQYVNVSGDTMTGALVINMNSAYAVGSGALSVVNNKEFSTGAYIYSSGTVLALESYSANGANKHILFGYRGQFDTNLYRSAVNVLKTDGSFFAAGSLTASGSLFVESGAYVGADIMFDNTRDHVIGVGSTSALGGKSLLVTAGDALTSGGDLTLRAGSNGSNRATISILGGGDVGGSINIDAADAGTSAEDGGIVNISAGNGGNVVGYVNISGGSNSFITGAGGNVYIYGGRGSTSGGASGSVVLGMNPSGKYAGNVGVGTLSPKTTFDVRGSMSGSALFTLSRYRSCTLKTTATGMVICGSDDTGGSGSPEVGTASFSGGILRLSDGRYVNTAGDIMTGALQVPQVAGNDATSASTRGTSLVVAGGRAQGAASGGDILFKTAPSYTAGAAVAASFASASSEYLSVTDNADVSFADEDFSIAGWVYFNTLPVSGFATVVGKYNVGSNDREYSLFMPGGTDNLRFIVTNNGASAAGTVDSTVDLVINTWYFVYAEHDSVNNELVLKVNANTADTVSYSSGGRDGASVFALGNMVGLASSLLDGRLDEVALYNRVLTPTELTYLYNAGAGRTYGAIGIPATDGSALTTSLVSWWDLDEASGARADSHGVNTLTDNNTVTSATGIVSASAGDLNTLVNRMIITSSGAVGIGTITPGSTLSVSGSMIINRRGTSNAKAKNGLALEVIGGMSGSIIYASTTLASSGTLVWEGVGSGSSLSLAGGNIVWSRSGAIVYNEFGNNVDVRMESDLNDALFYLDASTDRIGIGTRAPKTRFSVVGTMSGTALIVNRNASFAGSGIILTATGGAVFNELGNNVDFRIESDTNDALFFMDASTNRIGIGTRNPDAVFDVVGTMSGTALVVSRNAVFGGSGITLSSTGGAVFNEQSRNVDFRIEGDNTDALFFLDASTDRIGLGTRNPDTLLEIIGTASGTKIFSNNFAGSGMLVIESLRAAGSGVVTLMAFEYQTGAYISASGTSILALDSYKGTQSGSNAHILFGYRGNFDTNLYRSAASTLKTNGSLHVLSTISGASLVATTGAIGQGDIDATFTIRGIRNSRTLRLENGGAEDTSNRFIDAIRDGADSEFIVYNNGDVRYDGTASGPADYAEWMETNDVSLGTGELVSLDPARPNAIKRATGINDPNLFGVISTKPGILGTRAADVTVSAEERENDPSWKKVAFLGQVPTKVKGPVAVNDAITSSDTPGVGMKASLGQATVCIALEAHTGNGIGTINCLLGRNNLSSIGLAMSSGAVLRARDLLSSSGSLSIEGMGYFGSGIVIRSSTTNGSANLLTISSNAGSANNTVLRVNASGSVYTDGTFNSAGADYAEWFYSTDKLKRGEVVCIDVTRNNAVKRCMGDADGNVMGIVSTNPAFIGNSISGATGVIPPSYALIGLIGQVPAKVMIENGESIRPGDSLTAGSVPGYARKARAGESTVGVALEGLASGEGVINVLISRRNQSLTVQAVEESVLETIAAMEIEDEVQIMVASTLEDLNVDSQITTEVERQLAGMQNQSLAIEAIRSELNTLKAELAALKSQTGSTTTVITQTGSYNQAASLEVDGTLTTGGDARIGGDLHIDGTLNASSLFVPNGMSIDGGVVMRGLLDAMELRVASGAVIDGVMTINGALVLGSGAYIEGGSGTLSIGDLIVQNSLFVMGDITIEGLATFLGDVEVKGELIVSNKQAGFALIPASGTSVTVYFGSGMKATPVVTASPDVPVLYAVSKTSATGFTIRLAGPAPEDVTFSWHALSTTSPMTITANVLDDGSILFPTDDLGVPVSSNMVWNACIRNVTLLDETGQPLSCGRYHDQFTWMHPDLGMSFIWNTSVTPPLLKLPGGYEPTVTESAESVAAAFNTGDDEEVIDETEETSSSSAASSAESSTSSAASSESSAASESSVSSEAAPEVTPVDETGEEFGPALPEEEPETTPEVETEPEPTPTEPVVGE